MSNYRTLHEYQTKYIVRISIPTTKEMRKEAQIRAIVEQHRRLYGNT